MTTSTQINMSNNFQDPSPRLQVKRLSENASLPIRGSPYSAGFDLASSEATVIKAGQRGIVKTDLSIACPEGTYARIAPRSGLAVKKFIDVGAGVVDADYRGPVGVVLFNFGTQDFSIEKGDRVAQLILEQVSMVDAVEVEELTNTERGAGGFGSTGVSESDGPENKKKRTVSPSPSSPSSDTVSNDFDKSVLQVKRLSGESVIPTRGSPFSAGYDLSSSEDTVIKANDKGIVKTDLSIACPEGTYARIAPRSGLAVKKFIDVGAGVVDADYRGPVGVVLFNFGTEDFVIKKGDRIAQLILEKISMADAVEVEELTNTERGSDGFGSTGVSKDTRSYVLDEVRLNNLALIHGYKTLDTSSSQAPTASYCKEDVTLTFWLTTGTVGSYLDHPKQGKTQLFRREVTMAEAEELFKNPRKHTEKGYHRK